MASKAKRKRIRKCDLRPDIQPFGASIHNYGAIRHMEGGQPLRQIRRGGRHAPGGSQVNRDELTQTSGSELMEPIPAAQTIGDADHRTQDHLTQYTKTVPMCPKEAYVILLKQHQAVYTLTSTFTSFTLPDYDEGRASLKLNRYMVVTRLAVRFREEHHWLYSCTCDPQRAHVVEACAAFVYATHREFSMNNPECLHIEAMKCVLEVLQSVHEIPALQQSCEENDPPSEQTLGLDTVDTETTPEAADTSNMKYVKHARRSTATMGWTRAF